MDQITKYRKKPTHKLAHTVFVCDRNEKALQIKMDSHLIEFQCEKWARQSKLVLTLRRRLIGLIEMER